MVAWQAQAWPVIIAAGSLFQGFEIAFHRLHYRPLVAGTTPPIAVDASDQHFIVVVDFH